MTDKLPVFDFLLPISAIDWPVPPKDASLSESDVDLEENDAAPAQSTSFLKLEPAYVKNKRKTATCYAATRANSTTYAIVAHCNGSLDIYSSVHDTEDPPHSPPTSNFPFASLSPFPPQLRIPKRPRITSSNSFSSLRSVAPSDTSRRSTASKHLKGTRRTSKSTATLSVSGIEAFTSQAPEQKKSFLPSLMRKEEHQVKLLTNVASRSREELGMTLSQPSSTPSDDEEEQVRTEDLTEEKLHHRLTVELTTSGDRDIVALEILKWPAWVVKQHVQRTPYAIALTRSGVLLKISLKDGRAKTITHLRQTTSEECWFCLAYVREHAHAIVFANGALKLVNIQSGKIRVELPVESCRTLYCVGSTIILIDNSGAISTSSIVEVDARPTMLPFESTKYSCVVSAVDAASTRFALLDQNNTLLLFNIRDDNLALVWQESLAFTASELIFLEGRLLVFAEDAYYVFSIDDEVQMSSKIKHTSHWSLPLQSITNTFNALISYREHRLVFLTLTMNHLVENEVATLIACRTHSTVSTAIWTQNDHILAGYKSGILGLLSCRSLLEGSSQHIKWLHTFSGAAITYLKDFRHLFVVGTEDGRVGLVDGELKDVCDWHLFDCSIAFADFLTIKNQEHLLAMSENGSLALCLFREASSVQIQIPAMRDPVTRVFISWPTIVIISAGGKARMFDIPSKELRRSMTEEIALTEVSEATWRVFDIEPAALPEYLRLDLRIFIQHQARLREEAETKGENFSWDSIQFLLSIMIPSDLSKSVSSLRSALLPKRTRETSALCICTSSSALSINWSKSAAHMWTLSRHTTSHNLLSIVSLLRLFLSCKGFEADASRLTSYFASNLPKKIGPRFEYSSFSVLAEFWYDREELSDSTKLLFSSTAASLDTEDLDAETARWHSLLPISEGHIKLNSLQSKALLILGVLSIEHHSSMHPIMLKDMASLILALLHADTNNQELKIALELCDRCFEMIQEFVDPLALLHGLLALSAEPSLTISTRGAVSRALLTVAASNPGLFVTTLAFDVLHTKGADHRIAILKLVISMIKRRPTIFTDFLSSIAEAVVKSLDPRESGLRNSVQASATAALSELVRTYPHIDFNKLTQKLAVGTPEGACIMYDLKTSTRLYVLHTPGIHSPVTAVSFSPDGRRLVTLSLQARIASGWKVGSSLMGLVAWGKVPRQHGTASTTDEGPFKTFDTPITDDNADLSASDVLSAINMDWLNDRSICIKIKAAAFTFGL